MKNPALIFLLSIFFFLLISPSAHAQGKVSTTTGNSLLESCESDVHSAQGYFNQSFCLGYIIGVADTQTMVGSVLPENRRSCIPENASYGQIKDVVVKYLKEHPEERHMLAAVLIVKAIAEAFPCKSQ